MTAIKESRVRDHFASRYVRARMEVSTAFGRIDVMTPEFAIEVEPFATWKHGVRQALAYAQETGLRPAVALYGDMTPNEAARVWDLCSGLVTVFLLDHTRWTRIRSAEQAYKRWTAPPSTIGGEVRKPYRRWVVPGDKRTPEELMRSAAEAMDRAMAGLA